ncbi:FAD:protein FMN transferase [Rhodoferax sp. 4810]|uniref:FAD:protein FMN transferase n=2 Tax=Thiospirillum jenense TaxID=1653858 RepID=A0A839HF51_9GAMM|nr:FAD:protein FMN transferase [Rhodoferax jenense]MBB1126016.1 FAD:protein FMN transferase [Thiospirillum jenense]
MSLCLGIMGVKLTGCQSPALPQLDFTGPTMGTYYAVTLIDPPESLDATVIQTAITTILQTVINEISTYEPNSELSRLNHNPSTDWLPISLQLYTILAEGQRLAAITDGAFDITIGPLVNLWGFGPDKQTRQIPNAEQIAFAKARVGWKKLTLQQSPPMVRKARPDVFIDLSALGEGVGADRLAEWFNQHGIQHYLIAVAGALRVRGHNAHGQPWRIAIEAPIANQRDVHRMIPMTNCAVATSGDYRNFFEQAGQHYSHEINPVTGQPVNRRLGSVTVIGDVGMTVDGWATALMVLGEQRGLAIAEAQKIAAYFIIRDEQNQLRGRATTAFNQRIAQ